MRNTIYTSACKIWHIIEQIPPYLIKQNDGSKIRNYQRTDFQNWFISQIIKLFNQAHMLFLELLILLFEPLFHIFGGVFKPDLKKLHCFSFFCNPLFDSNLK